MLASGSPRRAALLNGAGIEVIIRRPDVDETPNGGELPTDYVARLSVAKANAGPLDSDAVVVAADTTVDLDGRIVEKPVDADDARQMLSALSGRTHLVHTGVTVRSAAHSETQVVTTAVTFDDLSDERIERYVATGEPFDKAGGYAIQERAAGFVLSVDGSVTNVVGLPLAETLSMIRRCR